MLVDKSMATKMFENDHWTVENYSGAENFIMIA